MIVFSDVTKNFKGREALKNVNFSVNPGEFVCITGPSGAGKSTIVHLLICAETPTSGSIEVDGQNLANVPHAVLQLYRRRTGVVFQDYKLLSDRTVYDNIAFAMEVSGDPPSLIRERVAELLAKVGLAGREKAYPSQLSGGERARAAIARALVHKPMIVIADEPTGNIDPVQSQQILTLLQDINREGATVILATHDDEIVDKLQTRVLRLENGSLVRDSVGGYSSGVPTQPVTEKKSHKVFEKNDGEEEEVKIIAAEKKESVEVPSGGRKIKPIAI